MHSQGNCFCCLFWLVILELSPAKFRGGGGTKWSYTAYSLAGIWTPDLSAANQHGNRWTTGNLHELANKVFNFLADKIPGIPLQLAHASADNKFLYPNSPPIVLNYFQSATLYQIFFLQTAYLSFTLKWNLQFLPFTVSSMNRGRVLVFSTYLLFLTVCIILFSALALIWVLWSCNRLVCYTSLSTDLSSILKWHLIVQVLLTYQIPRCIVLGLLHSQCALSHWVQYLAII